METIRGRIALRDIFLAQVFRLIWHVMIGSSLNEQKLSPGPGEPPEVECHWCHEGLMVPIKYRFCNGKTFQLTDEELRALRARANDNEL